MESGKAITLRDEIEEFIAEHDNANPHYLRDDEIVDYFSNYPADVVLGLIKDVR